MRDPYICVAHLHIRVWDKFVGDSRVTWADLDGLSACRCQTRVQAAPAWLRGCCQISSQRPLACWQRRVRMPVAPGWDQCMPESFRRCPTIALHPASTTPEPTNMPRERKRAYAIRC